MQDMRKLAQWIRRQGSDQKVFRVFQLMATTLQLDKRQTRRLLFLVYLGLPPSEDRPPPGKAGYREPEQLLMSKRRCTESEDGARLPLRGLGRRLRFRGDISPSWDNAVRVCEDAMSTLD